MAHPRCGSVDRLCLARCGESVRVTAARAQAQRRAHHGTFGLNLRVMRETRAWWRGGSARGLGFRHALGFRFEVGGLAKARVGNRIRI
eukprot:6205250-Pleurochrysis_carterae.AAC.1